MAQSPWPPQIQSFGSASLEIAGVGGSCVNVRGYIDVPLELAWIEVAHPVVVEELPFPLLVSMVVLRAHAASVSLDEPSSLQLQARFCETCLETRFTSKPAYKPLPRHFQAQPVAYTVAPSSIKPMSATLVTVRLPSSILSASEFVADPLLSLMLNYGCVVLPSVCALTGSTCRVAVANPSRSAVELCANLPIASVHAMRLNSPSTVAASHSTPRLLLEEKLRKVMHELKLEEIPQSAPHKVALVSLVTTFIGVFADSDPDVGTTDLVIYEIDPDKCRPLRQPACRIPYGEMRSAVENEIDKLVNSQIARHSTSPLTSPIVMVRKKYGGWRMCVDYRRINALTKFNCFPLPRLDEDLDAFYGAVVFSSLDLAMAYHQVPVAPSGVEKTAFVTHVGLFEMIKMLFCLCNALSTYQHLISVVLQGFIGRISLAYLDDVIVVSRRISDHVTDLRAVFERV